MFQTPPWWFQMISNGFSWFQKMMPFSGKHMGFTSIQGESHFSSLVSLHVLLIDSARLSPLAGASILLPLKPAVYGSKGCPFSWTEWLTPKKCNKMLQVQSSKVPESMLHRSGSHLDFWPVVPHVMSVTLPIAKSSAASMGRYQMVAERTQYLHQSREPTWQWTGANVWCAQYIQWFMACSVELWSRNACRSQCVGKWERPPPTATTASSVDYWTLSGSTGAPTHQQDQQHHRASYVRFLVHSISHL